MVTKSIVVAYSIKVSDIIESICRHYNSLTNADVKPEELYSNTRRAHPVRVRYIIFHILQKRTSMTYEQIGSLFNKSYSSVSYGIRTIRDEMEVYRSIEEIVRSVEEALPLPEDLRNYAYDDNKLMKIYKNEKLQNQ